MQIRVQQVENEPIVVLTYIEPTDRLHEDVERACDEVTALVGNQPYVRISDFTQADMSFSTLMMKLGQETAGRRGSISDPQATSIFVGDHDMVEMAIDALKQDQYGAVHIIECETVDEAIAYAREAFTPATD